MPSYFARNTLMPSRQSNVATDEAVIENPFGVKLLNLGMTASIVCAIECAITPVLLIVLPFIVGATTWRQLNTITESFDWIDAIVMGLVGIIAFSSQLVTLPIHQRLAPIASMTIGFLLLVCGRFVWTGEELGDFLFTLCGAGAMIVGGIWSRRLCRNGHHALCSQDRGPSCSKSEPHTPNHGREIF